MLVLCSRNARPEKGLVRRLHLDQHECPSQGEKASEHGRILQKSEGDDACRGVSHPSIAVSGSGGVK
jgi:hypothetical protein